MSEKDKKDFFIYRRRLPHWRLVDSVYFVTWRLHPSQPELTPAERGAIVSALRFFDGQKYELIAYVVMHNHMHLLIKVNDHRTLPKIIHSWKSYTAHRLQREFKRHGSLWQDEYFDRIVRDELEFLEKAQYILNNPFKIWPEIENYEWVWCIEELTGPAPPI